MAGPGDQGDDGGVVVAREEGAGRGGDVLVASMAVEGGGDGGDALVVAVAGEGDLRGRGEACGGGVLDRRPFWRWLIVSECFCVQGFLFGSSVRCWLFKILSDS